MPATPYARVVTDLMTGIPGSETVLELTADPGGL